MRYLIARRYGPEVAMIVATIAAFAGFARFGPPAPVHFHTIEQFREFVRNHGLFCHSGRADESAFGDNVFVGDHPLYSDDLIVLNKGDCGINPRWRGIVWITEHPAPFRLCIGSIGGATRIWGNLLVAGDLELMDHIEALWYGKFPGVTP